jgi:ATP-dependent Clp protease ATP-binding subunit ClpC
MTSNIGARFIEKKGRMGFASSSPKDTATSVNEMVMGEVKRTFNPEFINRVDEIIIFDALTDDDLARITRLLVEQLNHNLKEKGITVTIRDEGVQWLLQKTLSDRSYGARPLRRAIQRHIEDTLSEAFIRGQIRSQRAIEIGVEDGGLWYWQEGRGGSLSP